MVLLCDKKYNGVYCNYIVVLFIEVYISMLKNFIRFIKLRIIFLSLVYKFWLVREVNFFNFLIFLSFLLFGLVLDNRVEENKCIY